MLKLTISDNQVLFKSVTFSPICVRNEIFLKPQINPIFEKNRISTPVHFHFSGRKIKNKVGKKKTLPTLHVLFGL